MNAKLLPKDQHKGSFDEATFEAIYAAIKIAVAYYEGRNR